MTTTVPATFDAETYKATTRTQWENAADAWHRSAPAIETWLGESNDVMLGAPGVIEAAFEAAGFGGPCEMLVAVGTKADA